jgi:hypothetical protein
LKRATQPDNTFVTCNLAQAGITRGQYHPFDANEIHRCNLFASQDPIVLVSSRRRAPVCTREREAGHQKGIVKLWRSAHATGLVMGNQTADCPSASDRWLTFVTEEEPVGREVNHSTSRRAGFQSMFCGGTAHQKSRAIVFRGQ